MLCYIYMLVIRLTQKYLSNPLPILMSDTMLEYIAVSEPPVKGDTRVQVTIVYETALVPEGPDCELQAQPADFASLLPTAEDVRDWVGGDTSNRFPFGRYDRLLGYTHRPRDIVDGIDGAVSTYTYDELNARTQINGAGGRGRPVI